MHDVSVARGEKLHSVAKANTGNEKSKTKWLALIIIFAVAAVVRLVQLNSSSFFVDEVLDLKIAQKSVQEIIFEPNSFPPLYHLLLKIWHDVWQDDLSIRWFSVVMGLATVGFVYKFVCEICDQSIAIWAAAIMAISPIQVYYSQQARSYALFILLVSIACWSVARALRTDRWRDWIGFAIVNVLGNYTHYYFPIVSLTLLGIVFHYRGRTAFGKKTVVVAGLIIFASIPAALLVKGDFEYQTSIRAARTLNPPAAAYTFFSFISGYTLGPSKAELQSLPAGQAVKQVLPFALAIGFCALPLAFLGARRLLQLRALLPAVLILLFPMMIVGAAGFFAGVTYNVRFVAWSQIGLAILLAAGCVDFKPWYVKLAIMLLVLVSALALYNRWYQPRYQNEEIRGALTALPDEPGQILVCSGYMYAVVNYYVDPEWKVMRLMDSGYPEGSSEWSIRQIEEATAAEKILWVVYSRSFHGDPAGTILQYLQKHYDLLDQHETPGVRLFRIVPKSQ